VPGLLPEKIAADYARHRPRTTFMPLNNVTDMTAEERELVGRWVAGGARMP